FLFFSIQSADDEDDEAFDPSLDDIPADLRSLNINTNDENYPSPPPDSLPSLSFEISPRKTDQLKSFTLPSGRSNRNSKRDSYNSSFYNEARSEMKKTPSSHSGSSLSDLSQENISQERIDIPRISTSPVMSNAPKGWTVEIEPQTHDEIFINNVTKERWKSCVDKSGRTYFYNMNGPGTTWALPEVSDSGRSKNMRRNSFGETLEGVIRRQTVSSQRSPRNKCHSVHVRSPSSLSSEEDKSARSPVVSPRLPSKNKKINHQRSDSNQSFEIIDMNQVVQLENNSLPQGPKAEKAGQLMRRKVVEGRKQIKKPIWTPIYICKYDSNLVFYKDQKTASPKPGFPTGKPESSLDLHGATLDHISKEKVKGKKYVFQIASYGGQNVHQFVADNQLEMGEWIVCIQATIHKLEEEEPLPPHPLQHQISNGGGGERLASPTSTIAPPNDLSPPPSTSSNKAASPMMPKKLLGSESKSGGFKGFSRRLSKRVTGGTDEEKDKTRIKDKLKKYLSKRPSFNELESKGIIADFVFGYPLEKLCEREDNLVPRFIVQIVHEVEKRGLDVDGIYRVSGNLSSVNKLRGLIDNGEMPDYSQPEWNDIHLLTGCLKLYFRELPEPLLPFHLFDRFVGAMKSPFKPEKLKLMREVVSELKAERKETLNLLLTHFNRVMSMSSKNRMHSQNIAIVFGPTLMWPETDSINVAMTTVFQNQVIEFLVQEWNDVYTM
uniref:Rho GTPase activating protein n=1 Tax=Clytia hemisphaerica TaxID=252671 RepID=A0A7M5XIR9_9CNID